MLAAALERIMPPSVRREAHLAILVRVIVEALRAHGVLARLLAVQQLDAHDVEGAIQARLMQQRTRQLALIILPAPGLLCSVATAGRGGLPCRQLQSAKREGAHSRAAQARGAVCAAGLPGCAVSEGRRHHARASAAARWRVP